jgi:ribosomal protein L11 methyltransferase
MNQTETGGQVYIEAFLEVPRNLTDAVCNFIIENFSNGLVLEEEDNSPSTGIRFYISEQSRSSYRQQLTAYLKNLDEYSSASIPEISEREISALSWEDEYRKSIPIVRVEPDVVICPPWLTMESALKHEIIIEPKMAFGTGRHETTISCLEAVRAHFKKGTRLLDVGCGSGILSILAAQMGAVYVKAVDHDLTAVENARENFDINNVTCPYDIQFGSIDKARDDEPYGFVVANIIKSTILEMLDALIAATTRPGILVLSGLLDKDEEEVSAALTKAGLSDFDISPNNEWRTYLIRVA